MKLKHFLVLTAMLFITTATFAMTTQGAPELGDPATLVQWLSPVIVWLAGMVVKPLFKIPGGLMLAVVVPLLSLGATWLVSKLTTGDLSWGMQFIYTLSAVFIDQVKKKATASSTKAII